jgi:hypothetical protein
LTRWVYLSCGGNACSGARGLQLSPHWWPQDGAVELLLLLMMMMMMMFCGMCCCRG